MKVLVYHSALGCDTGCCGHRFELIPDDILTKDDIEEIESGFFYGADKVIKQDFTFWHPDIEHAREWAENYTAKIFGEEHVKDLDWEHCLVFDLGEDKCWG